MTVKIILFLKMKWFLLFCCCFAAILLTADARNPGDSPDGRCAETRSWKEDCNTCWCQKGYFPACTLIGCPPSNYQPRSSVCEPNEIVKQDCNQCRCTADGTDLICTKQACVSKLPDDVTKIEEQENMRIRRQVCEPNELFDKDCKRCICNDEGSSYNCTQTLCVDELPNDVEVFNNTEVSDHSERQQVCVPNEIFKRDCNSCKCNQDGTDFSCTRKFCLAMEEVEVMEEDQGDVEGSFHALVCSPNESFEKNCNKCWCNKMGTTYSCTKKTCGVSTTSDDMEGLENRKQERKEPPPTKQKCEPRSTFKLDCNTCQCSNDGTSYYCTRRVCLPGLPDEFEENIPDDKETISIREEKREKRDVVQSKYEEVSRACNPGEEFRLDCNTCFCNNEGKDYSCSRFDCLKKPVAKRSVDSDGVLSCVPGSSFRLDCNTCRCSPDGKRAACTYMLCSDQPREHRIRRDVNGAGTACVPGSVFARGCSSCVCRDNGRDADCTDHADSCVSAKELEPVVKRDIESPSGLVCKAGETTSRDCNTCVCSEDGKKLSCTEKQCSFDDTMQKEHIAADDPDFRCTPGDQFKRNCNDCTCSANGKSVFCTLKLCV